MKGLHTIKLDTVKVEEKEYDINYGKDKGQKGKLWNISIKSGDTWYGGAVFKENHSEAMKNEEGKELELFLYQEEWSGKMYDKWIFPNDKKRPMLELIQRVEELEYKINSLLPKEAEQSEQPNVQLEPNDTFEPKKDDKDLDLPF